jgi:ribosomal protein S27E
MTFVTYRCRNCGTVGSFYDDEAGNLWCRRCGDQLEDIEDADKEETDPPEEA